MLLVEPFTTKRDRDFFAFKYIPVMFVCYTDHVINLVSGRPISRGWKHKSVIQSKGWTRETAGQKCQKSPIDPQMLTRYIRSEKGGVTWVIFLTSDLTTSKCPPAPPQDIWHCRYFAVDKKVFVYSSGLIFLQFTQYVTATDFTSIVPVAIWVRMTLSAK